MIGFSLEKMLKDFNLYYYSRIKKMAKIRKKEIKQEIKAKIKMLVSHIKLNCYLSYII